MGAENHGVLAFDGVDGDAGRGDVGAGDRDQRGDDAGWLAVFDNLLFGDFLDDADAFLAEGVAEPEAGITVPDGVADSPRDLREANSDSSGAGACK